MRKGQIEVIQQARIDRTYLEFHAARLNETAIVYIPADMEDGIRMHLVDAHKARKAAKKEERRFTWRMDGAGAWRVEDRDRDGECIAKFYSGEIEARAFAKMLNKRNRKPMGATE